MSRTPEVEREIRACAEAFTFGPEGYAWRGTARVLAAEVARMEAELYQSQRDAGNLFDEAYRAQASEHAYKQRAETAEARVADLEAQNAKLRKALEGLMAARKTHRWTLNSREPQVFDAARAALAGTEGTNPIKFPPPVIIAETKGTP